MLKAVLFDLYDTLAYVDIQDYRHFKSLMAAEAGLTTELFVSRWKHYTRAAARGEILTTEERVARVLRDSQVALTYVLIRKLSELEIQLQEQHVHLFIDAQDTLARLKSQGLRLGLVTNTSLATGNVPNILSIQAFFDTMVFSYAVGITKPEAGIYLAACERLGVAPEACLFVGDGNDRELDGARHVSMRTLMVGQQRHEQLRTEQSNSCDYRVEHLRELVPIVETLLG
jgi:putative hydrolase of the HAD superfamily